MRHGKDVNCTYDRRGDSEYHWESDDTTGREQATKVEPDRTARVSGWEG